MSNPIDGVTTAQYRLTLQHLVLNTTGAAKVFASGSTKDTAKGIGKQYWQQVVLQKLSVVRRVIEKLPINATALFTDQDVIPLAPWATLLPLPDELTFMREPPGHGGRTGRHIVNSGFFGVRVNVRTRRFFAHCAWTAMRYPRLIDQDITNWLLLAKPGERLHQRVGWTTWPRRLVTGILEEVTNQTIAYHAIFSATTEAKLARLHEAHRRAGRGRSARDVPPCERSSRCPAG